MTHEGMLSESIATALGVPQVIACPFAFDTPGLLTGAPIYTPTIGDLLLDGWVEVVTPWDQYGGFDLHGDPALPGIYDTGGGMDLTTIDATSRFGAPLLTHIGDNPIASFIGYQALNRTDEPGVRDIPARFVTTDPLHVVVNDNSGRLPGGDPGATQGAAILYLIIARPVLVTA